MSEVIDLAKRVATTDSTILLRGETGTGKELFARAIHSASLRKNQSFIPVNCASLPDTFDRINSGIRKIDFSAG